MTISISPASVGLGDPLPRPGARRLIAGEGCYLDDISLPNMAHVAFVRSPVGYARLLGVERDAALAMPGVVGVYAIDDLMPHCTSFAGIVAVMPGYKAPQQWPLAKDVLRWHGEAVVAVVADTRAQAEDAAAAVVLRYQALQSQTDMGAALAPDATSISPDLSDNMAWRMLLDTGGVDEALAQSDLVVEETFVLERQTAASIEPRGIIARYDRSDETLVLYHSTQIPHAVRHLVAKHMGLAESRVRVIVPDVGGSFGLKGNLFPDEFAVAVLAKLVGRPVKFVADRHESFLSDGHCRDHRITAKLGMSIGGVFQVLAVDGLCGIGAYSVYPKSGGLESLLLATFAGAPYRLGQYRADNRAAYLNKAMLTQHRGVGIPVACLVTEGMVDLAAARLGVDPVELRHKNFIPDTAYPTTTASQIHLTELSQEAALKRLVALMDYDALRREQAAARLNGIYRGIGIASFVEGTAAAPMLFGAGGVPISAQDAVTLRLEPDGRVTCLTGLTEQGQGGEAAIQQIVASVLGLQITDVSIKTGDTTATPYGAGTWASRSTSIAGEAALRAGERLRDLLLGIAAALTQSAPGDLALSGGAVVDRATGTKRMPLADVGALVHFRGHELPPGVDATVNVTEQFSLKDNLFLYNNGVSGCHLEVDTNLGIVRLLGYWFVGDCGTIVNRMLVDEQIRGAVVQGIGAALYEQLVYDTEGKLSATSFWDYRLPLAAEMPDIVVDHIETPTRSTKLGAKGSAEAGIIGASATIMNAINDALRPFDARVTHQPFTPERILRALGTLKDGEHTS